MATESAQTAQNQRAMIKKFIDAIRDQGFLDRNFDNLTKLHENRNALTQFCSLVESNMETLKKTLEMENVDFHQLATTMEPIRANAALIGGKRVATAAGEMLRACSLRGAGKLEAAKEAFKTFTWEYFFLRDCFHHILHANRIIHCNEEEDQ